MGSRWKAYLPTFRWGHFRLFHEIKDGAFMPVRISQVIGGRMWSLSLVRTGPAQRVTTASYSIADSPKMLRETLCVAQSRIASSPLDESCKRAHIERIQRLIDACDVHRPLGPDGKHGDRHTPTCGCEGDDAA